MGQALARYGGSAVPSLLAALQDAESSVRIAALEALGRIGEPIGAQGFAQVMAFIADADAAVRAAAIRAVFRADLLARRAADEVVEALLARLALPAPSAGHAPGGARGSEVEVVRLLAIRTLGMLGPEAAARAQARLLTSLREPSPVEIRREAATAWAAWGRGALVALPALIHAAEHDPDLDVQQHASVALMRLESLAAEAVPAMQRIFERADDPQRRITAAAVLGSIGEPAAIAADALLTAVADPHPLVAAEAVRALGRIGPAVRRSPRVDGVLLAALEKPLLRPRAALALAAIGPAPLATPAAAMASAGTTGTSSGTTGSPATTGLTGTAPGAGRVAADDVPVAMLRALVDEERPETVRALLHALAAWGPQAAHVQPALVGLAAATADPAIRAAIHQTAVALASPPSDRH